MHLTLSHIVKREEKHRSFADKRRKITCVIASYIGEDGHEYRKSFESYDDPAIPKSGKNSEISTLKIQY